MPLIWCRCSAENVRNDGATPRSPRGCLGPKVAPLAASGQQLVKRIRFVAAFHGVLIYRMRESIELPLLDSSLQPRIALARVNDQAQREVRFGDVQIGNL